MANRLIATWAAGGLVVGAVATGIVAATDAGGSGLHRLPIGAASASSSGATSAAGALDSASVAERSASTKIAAGADGVAVPGIARMYRTEFVVDGDLPALDGEATVWQLRRSAIKTSQVSDLATVFSLSGDPVKAPDYDAWTLGSTDGTKPMLAVDGGAGHRWYFSDPGAFPVAVDCAVAEPATSASAEPGATSSAAPDGKTITIPAPDECPTPEPPANLPSADQALVLAKALADKVGLGSANVKWETFGDAWSAGATAQLVLDGVVTEEPWLQVSFGGDAKVQWASGLLEMPSKVADYPRVGTTVALDKLRAMSSGMGDTGVMPLAKDVAVAQENSSSETLAANVVTGGPVTTECGPAVDCPAVGDTPTGPVEEVVQTVKLTGVTATLSTYYGSDEVLYLVPSYRFTDAEGGIWPVIALDDKYLANSDNTGGGAVSGSGGAPAPAVRTEPAPGAPTPETAPVTIAAK